MPSPISGFRPNIRIAFHARVEQVVQRNLAGILRSPLDALLAGFALNRLYRKAKPEIAQLVARVENADWKIKPFDETPVTPLIQYLQHFDITELAIAKGTDSGTINLMFERSFSHFRENLRPRLGFGLIEGQIGYGIDPLTRQFAKVRETELHLREQAEIAKASEKAPTQKTLTLAEELAAAEQELKEAEEHYASLKDEHDKVLAPLYRLNNIEQELSKKRTEQRELLKQIGNLGTRIKSLQKRLDSLDNKKTDEAHNLLKRLRSLKDLRKNKQEKAETMEKEAKEIEGNIEEYEISRDNKAKLFYEFIPTSEADLRSAEYTIKSLQDRINKLTGSHDYKATPTTALDPEQVEEIMKYFRT